MKPGFSHSSISEELLMSSPRFITLILSAVTLTALQACTDQPTPTGLAASGTFAASETVNAQASRHIVLFASEGVPTGFPQQVTRLGGSVEAVLDSIGVAAVTGLNDTAVATLRADPGIRSVEPDVAIVMSDNRFEMDDAFSEASVESFAPADATESPTLARFYARQWNMRAVFAPEAWAAGHLGSRDVVVAILDTGIDYLHPDLVGLVDLERSKSFVPEEDAAVAARFPGRLPFSDLFWHGTAVASVVASNAKVVAGVNRYVTLLAIKVADSTSRHTGARLLSGIVYAADQGADVINVSRGVDRDKSKFPGTVAAFERAANYAFRKGALIVSLPFNDAIDLDHNGDIVRFPCEAAHVICVSATAPTGAAGREGPWTEIDAWAPYSGFGRSAVDVAAPGGGGAGSPTLFTKVWLPCTATWTASTGRPECRTNSVPLEQRITQGIGTSWATPLVSGLAALLVAQLGHGNPALIRSRILESADDLGEPGTDPFYGKGRINIARALGVIH